MSQWRLAKPKPNAEPMSPKPTRTGKTLGSFRSQLRRVAARRARLTLALIGAPICALLGGCVSTTKVVLTPSPQLPVCDRTATALVLLEPQWRPDQKDIAQREDAAATGLEDFLAASGCFARSELKRTCLTLAPKRLQRS